MITRGRNVVVPASIISTSTKSHCAESASSVPSLDEYPFAQEMVMIPSYHKHLEDRKRRTLVMTGAVANSALSQSLLRVVFLDNPEGIAAFGDAIAANWPALIDLGATYGTAFLDSVRAVVG